MLSDSRQAMIVLGLDNKRLDADVREAKNKLLGLVKVKGLKGASALGGFMGGFTGNLAAGAIGKLTGMLSGGLESVLEFERGFTRLQIAGGRSANEMDRFRTTIMDVSNATGVARESLLQGASAYVRITGDMAGAEESVGLFAKVVQASGADMEDVANSAAGLRDALNIDPKDFKQAFDILITQGKQGSVELTELAKVTAGLGPQFSKLGHGTGIRGLQQMGAALQVGIKAFGPGKAGEAATALSGFVTAIARNASKFKAGGVSIYSGKLDKKGRPIMRDLRDIIVDIGNSKLAKKQDLLIKAFGDKEPLKFYDIMQKNLALYDELAASRGDFAVDKDSAKWAESSAGKIERAANLAKNALAAAFTPERIQKFADVMGRVVDYMAELIGYVDRFLGHKTKAEVASEKQDEDLASLEKRRADIARKRFGRDIAMAAPGTRRPRDVHRAMQAGGKSIDDLTPDQLYAAFMSDEMRKAVESEMATEAMIAAGLGGRLGTRSQGFKATLGEGFTSNQILSLLGGYIPTTSDPEALRAMATTALAKAMAKEIAKIQFKIENPESEHTNKNRNGRPH